MPLMIDAIHLIPYFQIMAEGELLIERADVPEGVAPDCEY